MSVIRDDRVNQIEQALMFALSMNARPTDTWGEVKKAVAFVCAEILSDHALLCGCGTDHAEQNHAWMEAVLETAKIMLTEKRQAKNRPNLVAMKPEGNA